LHAAPPTDSVSVSATFTRKIRNLLKVVANDHDARPLAELSDMLAIARFSSYCAEANQYS
jgi:hypothetical protein